MDARSVECHNGSVIDVGPGSQWSVCTQCGKIISEVIDDSIRHLSIVPASS